ncbi:class I SAM-dependent methyltransferase [Patescibacteria group bacterium]|nr:class I SAM-dependent methyltransferase [Patescibacteria group bacterium]
MSKQLSKHIKDKLEKLLSNAGDMSLKRRARRIIEELNLDQNEKIIDLGCGTGYYLYLLSNLPVKLDLTGCDNDIKALAEAKNSLSKKIEFIHGNLHKMPYKDNSFDKTVASEVLEHLENDSMALKEIFRILKPGGILVISVPNQNYPFLWDPINWFLQHYFNTHIKNGFFSGFWSGHIRLYSLKDLKGKVEKVGFKIEQAEELTFWCLPFNHYLVNVVARLLYDVKISSRIADKISKFKETKKPYLIELAFRFVNWVDKLNEIFPQKTGVNVFVKAVKP